jgi:hypothetical protein
MQRRKIWIARVRLKVILSDTENSRTAVMSLIHNDFDWYEPVHQEIKNGKIKD